VVRELKVGNGGGTPSEQQCIQLFQEGVDVLFVLGGVEGGRLCNDEAPDKVSVGEVLRAPVLHVHHVVLGGIVGRLGRLRKPGAVVAATLIKASSGAPTARGSKGIARERGLRRHSGRSRSCHSLYLLLAGRFQGNKNGSEAASSGGNHVARSRHG